MSRAAADGAHDGRRPGSSRSTRPRRRVVVAVGDADGTLVGATTWEAGYRHGEELLPAIGRLLGEHEPPALADRGDRRRDGPRRVHRAAGRARDREGPRARARPCRSSASRPREALLAAAERRTARRSSSSCSCRPGRRTGRRPDGAPPELLPGGREPELAAGRRLVAVDLAGRAPADAAARGEARGTASAGALLRLGAARLAAGDADDLARLVPEYVTLPRGVAPTTRGGRMVARPPVRLTIEPMRLEDLDAVH